MHWVGIIANLYARFGTGEGGIGGGGYLGRGTIGGVGPCKLARERVISIGGMKSDIVQVELQVQRCTALAIFSQTSIKLRLTVGIMLSMECSCPYFA